MTCQECDRMESAYLAGALSDMEAREVEMHAASCDACERRLEATTRRDLSGFAPGLPPAVRAHTIAAVRSRSKRRAAQVWWTGGIAAAAAVAVLAVGTLRLSPAAHDASATPVASTDSGNGTDAAVGASASATLAVLSSRDEFAALDAAIGELEAALAVSPDDVELRAFLASARTRRAELERQVQDAA